MSQSNQYEEEIHGNCHWSSKDYHTTLGYLWYLSQPSGPGNIAMVTRKDPQTCIQLRNENEEETTVRISFIIIFRLSVSKKYL